MNTVLNDNRRYKAMTAEEADALFAEIAALKLELVSIAADGDREIAEVKAKYARLATERMPLFQSKCDDLEEYIKANPERFLKPRSRKTEFGKYGKRDVSNVKVIDLPIALKYVKDHMLTQLYKVKESLVKKAIEKFIKDGNEVPGTKITAGERILMDVSQELIEKAKCK